MPIYAYRCTSCGHQLDALQKLSDAALVDCPACAAPALSKLLTAPGFQLKGSGWYATDFKGNGSGKGSSTGGDTSTSGESASPSAPACAGGCACH